MNTALRSEDWQFHMNDQRELVCSSPCRWLQRLRNLYRALTAAKSLVCCCRKPLIFTP
jgi:hypothetical protein